KKAEEADVVIVLTDMQHAMQKLQDREPLTDFGVDQFTAAISVVNKIDEAVAAQQQSVEAAFPDALLISAKRGSGVDALKSRLTAVIATAEVQPGATIITNTRHLAALEKIAAAVADIKAGMDNDIPGDLIALDIRQALHYIGEPTGQV